MTRRVKNFQVYSYGTGPGRDQKDEGRAWDRPAAEEMCRQAVTGRGRNSAHVMRLNDNTGMSIIYVYTQHDVKEADPGSGTASHIGSEEAATELINNVDRYSYPHITEGDIRYLAALADRLGFFRKPGKG